MKNLLFSFFTLLFFQPTIGQTEQTISPILIDKSVLSGIGLKQIQLDHEPDRAFFQKNLYRGEDLSVYVVSSQSWLGKMENFSIDEYIYMLNGKARVKPEGGEDRFFQTGDHFFATKGYTGEWEIIAGNQYHYELSVITTQRAPEVKISKTQLPQLLDKNKLSGTEIDLSSGNYEAELFQGDELTILLKGESPRNVLLETPSEEQVIAVLSGQLTLRDSQNQSYTFHTGDFLILPKGFQGEWISEGHGMLKYLTIQKS